MSELEEKLSDLLGSPEKMAQIMQLAKSFSAANNLSEPSEKTQVQTSSELDPRLLHMISGLMSEFSAPDKSTALLNAVQPYLRQERRDKVEKALKIARIAKLAGKAFNEMGGNAFV